MADGHLNKCKECTKSDVDKIYKSKIKNDPSFVEKERDRCRLKARKYKYYTKQTPESIKNYYIKYPEKYYAKSKDYIFEKIKNGKD